MLVSRARTILLSYSFARSPSCSGQWGINAFIVHHFLKKLYLRECTWYVCWPVGSCVLFVCICMHVYVRVCLRTYVFMYMYVRVYV